MSMEWLSKDLWRAHVSWLTPPWVGTTEEKRTDFDAKRWLDQIQSAHYQTLIFYIKHHDGFTAYPSKYSSIQPERDFFGECVAETRKRKMRILAYYSSTIDQITGNEHPDWQVMEKDGTPQEGWFTQFWPHARLCINNPGYRDLVLGQLKELRDNYEPDGFWLDVFSPHTGENCFCTFCREKYREETGGDLLETKGELWYESCFGEFMREIRALVKHGNPNRMLGQNTGIRIPSVDEHVDFYTHEAVDAVTISQMCRSLRSGDKPFESTFRLYSAVGSWAMKGFERVLLESVTSVVHGGACCLELPPTANGKIMDEAVERAAEVGKYIRGIERYLVGTKPVYDAAILQPDGAYGWGNASNWSSVFLERDIPFAFVYPDADLAPYQLVVLDDPALSDERLVKRLTEYVKRGGSLIVECDAACFDTPAGTILSEVLGIKHIGKTGYPAHYLSGVRGTLSEEMGIDDLIVEGEGQKVALTTAEALAWYRYEFSTRAPDRNILINLPPAPKRSNDPAITVNRYGKGRAMYIACPLCRVEIRNHKLRWDDTREYPVQLAANLARFMIKRPLLRGTTPAGVEVVVNFRKTHHIVHLLNKYLGGKYIDNRRGLLKLAAVPVSVNEKRIGFVKKAYRIFGQGKAELRIRRHAPWVEVRIPELSVHELIVLEH